MMLTAVEVRRFARFVVNGLLATAIHFGALTFLVEVVQLQSKGIANIFAALAGIAASFIGNRLFVFPDSNDSVGRQLSRFVALYMALAMLNGLLMGLWSDVLDYDYRLGFVLVSCVQLVASFLGNRILVFKE